MAVDFSGSWQMFEQGDPEEFLKAVSVPHLLGKMMKEVKPLMIIKQTGDDFVVSVKTPLRTNTNSFTLGKETEFITMGGVKTRATAKMVDGRLIIETEKVTHMREIQGEEMVEVCTAFFNFIQTLTSAAEHQDPHNWLCNPGQKIQEDLKHTHNE